MADSRLAVFFYDLGSPESYLAAERVNSELPVVPEWEPVLEARFEPRSVDRPAVEQTAVVRDLQTFRWPEPWPPDTETAMLAATYAKKIGRAVAFSLAAFRQAFAGGWDLGDQNTVLIAAAACEMHPTAVLKGISLGSTRDALEAACARAIACGVRSLPAIVLGGELFEGDAGVEAAVAFSGARR